MRPHALLGAATGLVAQFRGGLWGWLANATPGAARACVARIADRRVDEAERFALWLRKAVGKANGAWRKGAGGALGAKKSRALRDNPLPWASIDAYPEWIAALLSN